MLWVKIYNSELCYSHEREEGVREEQNGRGREKEKTERKKERKTGRQEDRKREKKKTGSRERGKMKRLKEWRDSLSVYQNIYTFSFYKQQTTASKGFLTIDFDKFLSWKRKLLF